MVDAKKNRSARLSLVSTNCATIRARGSSRSVSVVRLLGDIAVAATARLLSQVEPVAAQTHAGAQNDHEERQTGNSARRKAVVGIRCREVRDRGTAGAVPERIDVHFAEGNAVEMVNIVHESEPVLARSSESWVRSVGLQGSEDWSSVEEGVLNNVEVTSGEIPDSVFLVVHAILRMIPEPVAFPDIAENASCKVLALVNELVSVLSEEIKDGRRHEQGR